MHFFSENIIYYKRHLTPKLAGKTVMITLFKLLMQSLTHVYLRCLEGINRLYVKLIAKS